MTIKSNCLFSQVVWNFVRLKRDEMEKQEGSTLRDATILHLTDSKILTLSK